MEIPTYYELIRITEDSLVLLYRPNAYSPWVEADDYSKNAGSLFDKRGIIEISRLRKGQYALAMYDANLAGTSIIEPDKFSFKLYPNPAKNEVTLEFTEKHSTCTLEITDLSGHVVLSELIKKNSKLTTMDISGLAKGTYFLGVVTNNLAYDVKRFIVE